MKRTQLSIDFTSVKVLIIIIINGAIVKKIDLENVVFLRIKKTEILNKKPRINLGNNEPLKSNIKIMFMAVFQHFKNIPLTINTQSKMSKNMLLES